MYLTAFRKGLGPLLPNPECPPGICCVSPMVLAPPPPPRRAELGVLGKVWGKGKVEAGQVTVFHKRATSQASVTLPEMLSFIPGGLTREPVAVIILSSSCSLVLASLKPSPAPSC